MVGIGLRMEWGKGTPEMVQIKTLAQARRAHFLNHLRSVNYPQNRKIRFVVDIEHFTIVSEPPTPGRAGLLSSVFSGAKAPLGA